MTRHYACALLSFFVFISASLCAQTVIDVNQGEIFLPNDSYLVPQTVYVGDSGRLVASLGQAFNIASAFVLTDSSRLPEMHDVVFSRMELEKRNNNVRLIMDFVSYAPGVFALPPVLIPVPDEGFMILNGLEFSVASILAPEAMTLSQSVHPLAVPGTGLLVYGSLGLLLLIIILVTLGLMTFSRFFKPMRERFMRRKMLSSLEHKINILRTNDFENDSAGRNELFSLLAGEFRKFLSILSGINCNAFTPFEFTAMSFTIPGVSDSGFFYSLFRRWDELRFSGQYIMRDDIREITDELLALFLKYKQYDRH